LQNRGNYPDPDSTIRRGTIGAMPDDLTRADLERIAALASLELTDDEAETFTAQLAQILAYARQVQELDTSGVEATAHVLSHAPLDRPDEPRPSLDRAGVLAQAPDPAPEAGLFRVPRVIG
jgi:aspartyl-tRNA(Asn)/glutamyl-tRNA(Gln) amidotransferase subunit C